MISGPGPLNADDLVDSLVWSAQHHAPGERVEGDPWPESIWEIADKIATQGEAFPSDMRKAKVYFQAWLFFRNDRTID